MSAQELLRSPLWRPETLGQPIPASVHAVSVALPRWQDVVDYEEKDPEVLRHLQGGYPRFVIHPQVAELGRRLFGQQPGLPFPSARCAELCADFIGRNTGHRGRIVNQDPVFGVATTVEGAAWLRAFWQHTGLIVSSRQAEAALNQQPECAAATAIRRALRQQLAALYDCDEDDVFLTPTGMAAHSAALRAIQARCPHQPTAQLGFPYVDTYKLQQKFGSGGLMLHDLDHIADDLRALLQRQPLAGCFCEIPGNPLLGSADLRQITPILRAQRVPLIVDDVVATPVNVDLNRHADLLATSLTKYMAGTCDVMGGALICNPHSPLHADLKPIIRAQHEELLFGADAAVLEERIRDFPVRMRKHNENGRLIAERLRQHPAVERVWYPKWEFSDVYEAVRRPDGGWGALVTFIPRNAEVASPRIYDRLAVCKGPSLGTVFTLACPFTLLAHYTELDWAESCGVPRHLIRLSVGLEETEDLWGRIEAALSGG
jgi:cystathionine gamma-synthase